MSIKIGSCLVGREYPPFIIAEMSGNHNHSLERALEIVDAAAESGAHALKLQTYTADTITIDHSEGEFMISDPNSLWKGDSLYTLYQKAYTPWEWHEEIFNRCRDRGLVSFSTPFDESSVDFLESLDVPAYKIASFENAHIPLIRKVAATGKPLIISTGMATLAELDETVRTVRSGGCKDLILLKCTSSYPANPEDSNINTIPHMRELFDCEIGLSDHTFGIGVSIAAVALSATVIEKHFTLDRSDGGVDSAFSIEPAELKALVEESKRAWQSLGEVNYTVTEAEKSSVQFRRSIYIVEDVRTGEAFSAKNVKVIRPGFGLAPKYYDHVIGRRASRDIKRGSAISWEMLV